MVISLRIIGSCVLFPGNTIFENCFTPTVPPQFMIEALRQDLKNQLTEGAFGRLFEQLRTSVLDSQSSLYNDVIMIESRWNTSQRDGKLGTIDYQEKDLSFNNITQALLWLIDQINVEDLHESYKVQQDQHVAIPEKHVYTCNRYDQNDEFQALYYEALEEEGGSSYGNIHFFYLYGDARQEHRNLFKRLGYDLGGFLENWQKGDYDPGVKTLFVECKPRVSRNPKLFQINIMKALLAKFFEPLNQQQPILKKKLSDLLKSPAIQGFGAQDYVFILFTLDDHNWDKKLSPMIVTKLYEDFCNCTLGPDAPHFFFFFGIEYQKENKQVQDEVKATIEEAQYGVPLSELGPVTLADVREWISRYPALVPPGMEDKALAEKLFPSPAELDMADVTPILKQLLDQYNKGLVINLE